MYVHVRLQVRAALHGVDSQLAKVVSQKGQVDRMLEEEKKKLPPLQEKANQLGAATTEAAKLRNVAERAKAERDSAMAMSRDAQRHGAICEVQAALLLAEFGGVDAEIGRALAAVAAAGEERQALGAQLVSEQAAAQGVREAEKAKEAKQKEQLRTLMAQMEETDGGAQVEIQARQQAEKAARALEQRLQAAEEDKAEQAAAISGGVDKTKELLAEIAAREQAIGEAQTEADTQKRIASAAVAAKEQAVKEVANGQKESKRLIEEKDKFRDEAKAARYEVDQLKVSAYRDGDQMREDLEAANAERDAATEEVRPRRERTRTP